MGGCSKVMNYVNKILFSSNSEECSLTSNTVMRKEVVGQEV